MSYQSPPSPASVPALTLPVTVPPVTRPGLRTRTLLIGVALAVLGALAVLAVGIIAGNVGLAALPGAAVLALVPLIGVMLAVLWVDRWEREPRQALAVAFAWGASVAVLVSLLLNTGAMLILVALGSTELATILGAAVVAPVVEESIKALGVLGIFLVWRRSFDGPVDGLVYAAVVAAGFAFVENILYFGTAIAQPAQGGEVEVVGVFVMRAVMSPFAHVLFTACTGLALGLASRSSSRLAWLWALPVGVAAAIVLHAIWNGSAMMGGGQSFMGLYVLFQVPLFLGAIGLAFWLRRQEGVAIRTHLLVYASAGWFAVDEVAMVSSLNRRRQAAAWAQRTAGTPAGRAMRSFQTASTRLAYQRHRASRGPVDPQAMDEERRLLAEVSASREALHRALPV